MPKKQKPQVALATPPRHQQKGPISKLPTPVLPCPMCTTMFADPKRPGMTVGIEKRHVKKHLESHRAGTIKPVIDTRSRS